MWFLISWSLLLLLTTAAVVGFYLYRRADEGIRNQVEALLAQQYPHLQVSVRSARLLELEGFEIRGVSLSTNENTSDRIQTLATADEVQVRCHPRLDDLLKGKVEVEEIAFHGASVRCTRRKDGSWTISDLAKLPTLGGKSLPLIRIVNSTFEIVDEFQQPQRIYTLRDVNVTLSPHLADGIDSTAMLKVHASASGDHLQRFTIGGLIVPQTKQWRLNGNGLRIDLSPKLLGALPVEVSERLSALGPLVAKTELRFDVAYDASHAQPLTYDIEGEMRNGRIEDPRLPYPLTDISARFRCNHNSANVDELKGRYGGATLELGIQEGKETGDALVVSGRVRNFVLRQDLISRLSPELQNEWKKFKPLGNCDITLQLSRRNGQWSPNADITCHDVALTWEKFPYPLQNTKGSITLRGREIDFDLTSHGTARPLVLQGHIVDPGKMWRGWFEAKSLGAIPITEGLLAAGSAKMQSITRPFSPSGSIVFALRNEREAANTPMRKSAAVQLVNCSVRHAKFPYPIEGVGGRLEMVNDNWKFKNLTGRNDTAAIKGEGNWDTSREGGLLSLFFIGKDVPLESELRNALPERARETWKRLQPRGALDHVVAKYEFAPQTRRSSVAIELKQFPRVDRDPTESMSITPKAFPYRIDGVSGRLVYRDGNVQVIGMRGQHGAVQFATNGSATVDPSGRWTMHFDEFHADRLRMDAELLGAAPERLSRAITAMNLRGSLALDGKVTFSSPGVNSPTTTRWDLALDLDDGQVGKREKLEHIIGTVSLVGQANEQGLTCRGNLDIDSMTARGIQVSNMTSPYWFDGKRILMGIWAQPQNAAQQGEPLRARIFDGTLQANAQLLLDELGTFETRLRLDNANVAAVARDLRLPVSRIAGLASLGLSLQGNQQGRHTWRGKGAVQMTQTDLYELPIVLSLLKTLRTGSTDRSAFDEVAVDFRVQGEHTYLDHVDLRGDALTLKGAGEVNRQKDMNLNFYTIMGREKSYIQAVRPLLGMASRRFMVVKVRGPIEQPSMSREMLPGLNETLQEWFPESGTVLRTPAGAGSIQRASFQLHPGRTEFAR